MKEISRTAQNPKPKTQSTAATTKINVKNKPQSTGFIYLLVSRASELQLY